jgi:hypothetical protein
MKVLFMVDAYGDSMSANGACVREVAKEFLKNGHEVHIMGTQQDKESAEELCEGFYIHRIKPNLYNRIDLYVIKHHCDMKGKLAFLLKRAMGIRWVLLLPFYPLKEPLYTHRCVNCAKKLYEEHCFDLIVSCFSPLWSLFAVKKLKKDYGVKTVGYFVDTLTDNLPRKHFLNKSFMDAQGFKYEQRFFGYLDLILNLKCHEANFEQAKYESYKGKMEIVDIPHLQNRTEQNRTVIVYTGSIRADVLPVVIETFELLDLHGFELRFYSANAVILPKKEFIKSYGQKKREMVLREQKEATALLSIGNGSANVFIPSKTIEYISTGNAVIHFGFGESDSTYPYYSKYPNALILDVAENPMVNTEKIKKFLSAAKMRVTFEDLADNFPLCVPSYTYDKIIERLF